MSEFYVGAKIIEAEPEEKDGKPGYKVIYTDGYTSWSPKRTFEEAYFPIPGGIHNAKIVLAYAVVDIADSLDQLEKAGSPID